MSSRRRGFTLIEVLMSIALIGILGAAIVAGSGMLSGNRLRAAGGLVLSSVRLAVTRANATGRPVRIVFDLDSDRLLVEETEDRMLRVKDTGDKESEGVSAGAEAANEAEKEVLEAAKEIVEGPRAPRARFSPAEQFESDAEEGGRSLGSGIVFRQVQTEHDHDPRTEGRAYLYFWPGGGTERAVVQLARQGDGAGEGLSVLINALTGRAKLERGQVAFDDPYGDADIRREGGRVILGRPRSDARGGFTLLEVLVAIAILGLGLTAILSAQTGLFASSQRTEKLSFAAGLLRCRMTELELDLIKDGFPLMEEDDQGLCCEDERLEGFECGWKIEKVELPEATEMQTGEEGESGLGAMGALADIEMTKGAALGGEGDLSNLAEMMGGASAGASMAPLVMSMVYPQLKPMLEASIRRVTVSVKWKEGSIERDLTATQFLTQPQQGGLTATGEDVTNAAQAIGDALGMPLDEDTSSTSTKPSGKGTKK